GTAAGDGKGSGRRGGGRARVRALRPGDGGPGRLGGDPGRLRPPPRRPGREVFGGEAGAGTVSLRGDVAGTARCRDVGNGTEKPHIPMTPPAASDFTRHIWQVKSDAARGAAPPVASPLDGRDVPHVSRTPSARFSSRPPHGTRTLTSPHGPGHLGGGLSLSGSPPRWPRPLPSLTVPLPASHPPARATSCPNQLVALPTICYPPICDHGCRQGAGRARRGGGQATAALRHRRLAVRRPRRGDQRDAPADPGLRRRGRPPRP